MNELRNLILRLLQVIWIIFAICVVLAIVIFLISLAFASADPREEMLSFAVVVCIGFLVFIFSMLSIQYILFSSWNLNDLFDGSLMR